MMRRLFGVTMLAAAGVWTGAEPLVARAADVASKPAAAASQPALDTVLIRVGPRVITQEDYNHEVAGRSIQRARAESPIVMRQLAGWRQFSLYLKDHPDLINPDKLEQMMSIAYKEEGVKNREELVAKVKARNQMRKLDDFLDRVTTVLARTELVRRGEELAKDEKLRREVFDQDPSAFDGSRVRVRHIVLYTFPWETPAQLAAKREKLARIREDLVSGRRTWEQCVEESEEAASRIIGGDLGMIPRHLEKPEVLAKAAFQLKPGQTSEVIESGIGLHILQVTETSKGTLKYDDATVTRALTRWISQMPLLDAEQEAMQKYPVVGLREPGDPPPPPPPTTKPAVTTRPVGKPATRPQMGFGSRRPTTLPARGSTPSRMAPRPPRATTRPAGK